jgi:hypothetical protein
MIARVSGTSTTELAFVPVPTLNFTFAQLVSVFVIILYSVHSSRERVRGAELGGAVYAARDSVGSEVAEEGLP